MKYIFPALLLNALLWLMLVPMWHAPDEQAHFGQVAFMAQTGRTPGGNDDLDLTEEIYTSELLLGTARDTVGNNRFTFHPEFRIPYTDSWVGMHEASIAALAKTDVRNTFIHHEATRYPVLYYIPASAIYRVLSAFDLFVRVWGVRVWSLCLFLGTLVVAYRFLRLLFSSWDASLITILIGFQPMMVFANIGVNSDSLGNFLGMSYLYAAGLLIVRGATLSRIALYAVIVPLSFYTKPQFLIMLPATVVLFGYIFFRASSRRIRTLVGIALIAAAGIFFWLIRIRYGPLASLDTFLSQFAWDGFVTFLKEYTLPHTYREVMPWFWGIYDWLGVTYPRVVHRTINWVVLLSLAGFCIAIAGKIRKKSLNNRKTHAFIFSIFVSGLLFAAVSLYDWYLWRLSGFPLGVQGRYFFPVIAPIMAVIYIGWRALLPQRFRLRTVALVSLASSMVLLNMIALYTVAAVYYDVSSLGVFISQYSQYKPWIIKGYVFLGVCIMALAATGFAFTQIVKGKQDERSIQK